MKNDRIILGAGVTGLSAGVVSGLAVFEAEAFPGGLCSSYYIRPGSKKRLQTSLLHVVPMLSHVKKHMKTLFTLHI